MTNTKAIVMSRVRAIHFMRPFVSTGALCAALVLVSLYAISREVWVAMVFRNMPNVTDLAAVTRFFLAAFTHTHLVVQGACILALGSALWFIIDALRTLTAPSFARA